MQHGEFKCKKLVVHLKSTLSMIFEVLYKYLNCVIDKTIDSGDTTSTDCNTKHRKILSCYLLLPGASLRSI